LKTLTFSVHWLRYRFTLCKLYVVDDTLALSHTVKILVFGVSLMNMYMANDSAPAVP